MPKSTFAALAAAGLLASATTAPAQRTVASSELLAPPAGEWLNYGRTYDNQRFSPLTAINRDNVRQLAPVAVYQLNVQRADGLEATPIVAGGVMYVTTSHNNLLAFDLRTNRRLWQYEHQPGKRVFCCGPVNRGVAVAGDQVFMATLDAHLIAIDARTGEVRCNVLTHPPESSSSQTAAPLVIGNKVIIGVAGGEYGIRGSVSAYDTERGGLIWRFNTVPSPNEGGWWGKWATATPWGDRLPRDIAAERADSATYADTWKIGGAPVWVWPSSWSRT